MIDVLFANFRAALKANGVPFEIVYGPTQVQLAVGASRIQMFRDVESGDQIKPPRARTPNPRMFAVIGASMAIRIFAHSTTAGAGRADHDVLAMRMAQQVIPALEKQVRALKTTHMMTRIGHVKGESTDPWAGAIYEIRFQLDLGMSDVTWTDGKAGEMTMTSDTAVTALDVTGPVGTGDLPTATTRIA